MRQIFLNKKNREDEDLLILYQEKNDSEALGILYNRYLHLVYGLCLKYLRDREKSQDAVMDIYEKISSSLPDQKVEHFKSWLYVVAKNHCLMILRKKNPEVYRDIFMEKQVELHLNDEEPKEFQLAAMEKCIEALKNGQKECISLFYLKEKSYKEIERESKYSMKEVKSLIQNGRRNLKNCMERENV